MMSAIVAVFETFPPRKDSMEDSSSLRRRTRSSSEVKLVDAVVLELDPEEGPGMGCAE